MHSQISRDHPLGALIRILEANQAKLGVALTVQAMADDYRLPERPAEGRL